MDVGYILTGPGFPLCCTLRLGLGHSKKEHAIKKTIKRRNMTVRRWNSTKRTKGENKGDERTESEDEGKEEELSKKWKIETMTSILLKKAVRQSDMFLWCGSERDNWAPSKLKRQRPTVASRRGRVTCCFETFPAGKYLPPTITNRFHPIPLPSSHLAMKYK